MRFPLFHRQMLVSVYTAALVGAIMAATASATAQSGATPNPPESDAPVPVTFPRDDGPHDAFTEWWYYTGHLFTGSGDRFGFEYVFFKARRGALEGYVGHFAITDIANQSFQYDQRIAAATGVSAPSAGFDLTLNDWSMQGANGEDTLQASLPGYAIDLSLSALKPPVLHDGDGYLAYGDGTASYYYSRTRMQVTGTLDVAGDRLPVTGEAWMDHQWGDFETFDDGGWGWFAVQLDDNTELMVYLIRDLAGDVVVVDGSLVDSDGQFTMLEREDFTLRETDTWTSPETGITYPSGWTITVPFEELELSLVPSVENQELDTTATTGVIYWEGENTVTGRRGDTPVSGLAYVELTGYTNPSQLSARD